MQYVSINVVLELKLHILDVLTNQTKVKTLTKKLSKNCAMFS